MSSDSLNNRLYTRMQQAIRSFRIKEISLQQLIGNLEGLHNLLENPDANWVRQFYEVWPLLEEVYAVALDSANGILDSDDGAIVDQSLEKMMVLLDEIIGEDPQDY
jgi:hypothetical protein